MHQAKKRDSLTATRSDSKAATLRDADRPDQIAEVSERFAIKRVIDPPTLATIREQAGILQGFEMEREARLTGLERAGQVAHALFTIGELVKDAKPCLISEGVEQTGRSLPVSRHRYIHRLASSAAQKRSARAKSDGRALQGDDGFVKLVLPIGRPRKSKVESIALATDVQSGR